MNLNTPAQLLAMHLTSVGRGCNMILDMSPTSTGLLQQNDVDAYAGFGAGARALYPPQPAAESYPARGVSTVELVLPSSDVSRGAIELRENLTMGQAIESYNVSHSVDGKVLPSCPSFLPSFVLLTCVLALLPYLLTYLLTCLLLELGAISSSQRGNAYDWEPPHPVLG